MRIGVLCPAEIAFRRFMPAMVQVDKLQFAGIAVNSVSERYGANVPDKTEVKAMLETGNSKADRFIELYGGKKYESYEALISSSDIEAVYIPLPPALHYYWAKKALENGKHVMVEKPATISAAESEDLVATAQKHNLALHENYMFVFHDQLSAIDELVRNGEIGEVRLYRIAFGFPQRAKTDFRYNRELGGGSLIDAGGYTIKYAMRLLGDSATIQYARLCRTDSYEVDILGDAVLTNDFGQAAQIAFGMDHDYKCELEIWGSKGTLRTGRVLTAPAGFTPTVTIKKNTEIVEKSLPSDDAFKKSIEYFVEMTKDPARRNESYQNIVKQAKAIDTFWEMAKNNGYQ